MTCLLPSRLVVALLALAATAAGAQAPEPRASTVILPVIGSAPETGLVYGVTALRATRPAADDITRPSLTQVYAAYTTKQQFSTWAEIDWWTPGNVWRLNANVEYRDFPLPYYGVGGDTPKSAEEFYSARGPLGFVTVQRQIVPHGYVVGGMKWWSQENANRAPTGALASGGVAGAAGGRVLLAQLGVAWDTRDNVLAARTGDYTQLTWSQSDRAIGSEFMFRRLALDARHYVPLGGSRSFALQLLGEHTLGEAPFDQLALVGSSSMLRGYTKGRYRDRTLLGAQVEFRAPVYGRFSSVLFAGGGAVAPSPRLLTTAAVLPSYGGGLRYAMGQSGGSLIRLDVGLGRDAMGIYVGFQQAF